ncbi:hypothetical protein EDD37DRAFT_391018 [Exophiala viscosa]|uniref:Uncharacterized protein n=1 Tax=Exophiala viscosa TaxID=2486360 RepID=A0AAN6DYV3_9EURO|nr:hypothetical protein EDD36DRAFT_177452 [Exophiala viscosa]KAI1623954.1 hypothetical protein EDD37DRAFT_391018 [Exophiala viscosa]
MHLSWSLVSLSAAAASAQDPTLSRRLALKYSNKGPRGVAYTNSTALSNSSTTTTSTSLAPPSLPVISTGSWTNSSVAVFLNSTTDTPTCTGSVTYVGAVPPTVYVTVTEGFDVTVTASNVSVTDTATLITPLPACQATVIPGAVPGASNAPFIPANATAETASPTRTGGLVPQIFPASLPQVATASPEETATAPPFAPAATQATPVYTSASYTSTVIVTKKTPVTVVAPSTTSPAVNFQSISPASAPSPPSPTTRKTSSTASPGGNNAPGGGNGGGDSNSGGASQASSTGGSGTGGSNQGSSGGNSYTGSSSTSGSNSGSGNTGEGSSKNGNTAGSGSGGNTNPGAKTNIVATSSPPTPNQAGAGTGQSTSVATTSTKLGLGNIIASILNSPFATPAPTTSANAIAPLTTTVDNVRVVVSSSDVIIGSQTIAIPTAAATTVQANGATFTVHPSEIVAPSATITITRVQQNNVAMTSAPVQTVSFITTVGDLTFTVGPTVAILSGTTYRIGANAPATTVIVHGTKVSIGSDGVGLPSTTIAPATLVTSPFVVYTTEGLTFSVDQSEVVVAGTTYQIGSDASQVKTTIAGETISFGPGGVGLDSTTIVPTAPPSQTTTTLGSVKSTTASKSHTAASSTQSATETDSGASAPRLSLLQLGGWPFMAVILAVLVF